MNTTTTDATTPAGTAATKSLKATPGKRRMPRQASNPAKAAEGSVVDMPQQSQSSARAPSKIASVVALLERPEGATLAELVEATGWLPHTTRAALTRLKKKGHLIAKDKRGDVTCYHIAASA